METESISTLPDVQSSRDPRNIAIDRVGVRGVKFPITVASDSGSLPTVATFCMTVGLPAEKKGTHMSRFVALLEEHCEPLDVHAVERLLIEMLERLEAVEGTIEIRFPFFIRKQAPVSKLTSIMNYEAAWIANSQNGVITVKQETKTPVTSLCPCSKEISRYGAHNQRSHLVSSLILKRPMSLEQQIAVSEQSASCQLWSRLKRSDEKFVTEYAYDNPKFVEDLVRDIANAFRHDPRVSSYYVEAENFESIHNHSAYAYIAGQND
ncbi:protein containing DUF198 [gut metagenome]|uniref:Protein containing DUF198 n=1 Tax=gut metagenome TaxID=749906 RepID=J9GEJ8_9ZZZZ